MLHDALSEGGVPGCGSLGGGVGGGSAFVTTAQLPHSHSTPAGVDGTGGGSRTPPATPKKGGKMLAVRVQMLDDSVTMFQVQAKALGRVLFDQVCKQLHLLEADYFGLEYQDTCGTKYWLDLEKPMSRQVGLSLVDTLLRFCVKFYTPDPAQLEEEFTRYLYCLQIKRDLAQGLLQCNDNTAALMASYIVQAECGDYVVEDYPDHTYLSTYKFVPNQDPELERRIMENHKKHAGQSPAEADLNLLETSRRCELYGMKMHPAKDHEGVPLNLAVAHMGIVVFQNYTKINTFSWAKIRKISFKRKRFLIKLHPEGYGYYKDTVEFFFEGRNECKNFWKKCVENHGFFRCSSVKHVPRQKTRVLSRGSSFRYSGRTQKQIVEFVRENYVKRQTFQRSQSFRHAHSAPSSVASVGASLSAHPLLPLGENAVAGTPASLSCGSMTLASLTGTAERRRSKTPPTTARTTPARTIATAGAVSPSRSAGPGAALADVHDWDSRLGDAALAGSPSPPLTESQSPATSATSSPQHFYPLGRGSAAQLQGLEGSCVAGGAGSGAVVPLGAPLQRRPPSPGHPPEPPSPLLGRADLPVRTDSSGSLPRRRPPTQQPLPTQPPHMQNNTTTGQGRLLLTTTSATPTTATIPGRTVHPPSSCKPEWQRNASCRSLRRRDAPSLPPRVPSHDDQDDEEEEDEDEDEDEEDYEDDGAPHGYYDALFRRARQDAPVTRFDDARRTCYSATGSKASSVDRGGGGVCDGLAPAAPDARIYSSSYPGTTSSLSTESEGGGRGSECVLLAAQDGDTGSQDDLSHDSYELLEREDDEDGEEDDEDDDEGAGWGHAPRPGPAAVVVDGFGRARARRASFVRSCSLDSSGDEGLPLDEAGARDSPEPQEVFHMDALQDEPSPPPVPVVPPAPAIIMRSVATKTSLDVTSRGVSPVDFSRPTSDAATQLAHFPSRGPSLEVPGASVSLSPSPPAPASPTPSNRAPSTHFGEYNPKCGPGLVLGWEPSPPARRRPSAAHPPVERARSDPHASPGGATAVVVAEDATAARGRRQGLMHQKSIDLGAPVDGDLGVPYVLHKRQAMSGTASASASAAASAAASALALDTSGAGGGENENILRAHRKLLARKLFEGRSSEDFESLEKEQSALLPVSAITSKPSPAPRSASVSPPHAELRLESRNQEVLETIGRRLAASGDRDSDSSPRIWDMKRQREEMEEKIEPPELRAPAPISAYVPAPSLPVSTARPSPRPANVPTVTPPAADLVPGRKRDRSPVLFARARLGLSEGSAFSPVHRASAEVTAGRRAKSLDAPVVAVHALPPATAFSSKDDTLDDDSGPPVPPPLVRPHAPGPPPLRHMPSVIQDEDEPEDELVAPAPAILPAPPPLPSNVPSLAPSPIPAPPPAAFAGDSEERRDFLNQSSYDETAKNLMRLSPCKDTDKGLLKLTSQEENLEDLTKNELLKDDIEMSILRKSPAREEAERGVLKKIPSGEEKEHVLKKTSSKEEKERGALRKTSSKEDAERGALKKTSSKEDSERGTLKKISSKEDTERGHLRKVSSSDSDRGGLKKTPSEERRRELKRAGSGGEAKFVRRDSSKEELTTDELQRRREEQQRLYELQLQKQKSLEEERVRRRKRLGSTGRRSASSSKDGSRDDSRDGSRDISRDSSRDLSREGSRDLSREGSRDLSREGSRDLSREGSRELSREGSRELSREGSVDLTQDGEETAPRKSKPTLREDQAAAAAEKHVSLEAAAEAAQAATLNRTTESLVVSGAEENKEAIPAPSANVRAPRLGAMAAEERERRANSSRKQEGEWFTLLGIKQKPAPPARKKDEKEEQVVPRSRSASPRGAKPAVPPRPPSLSPPARTPQSSGPEGQPRSPLQRAHRPLMRLSPGPEQRRSPGSSPEGPPGPLPISPLDLPPLSPKDRRPLSPKDHPPHSPKDRPPLSPTGRPPLSPTGRPPLSPTSRAPAPAPRSPDRSPSPRARSGSRAGSLSPVEGARSPSPGRSPPSPVPRPRQLSPLSPSVERGSSLPTAGSPVSPTSRLACTLSEGSEPPPPRPASLPPPSAAPAARGPPPPKPARTSPKSEQKRTPPASAPSPPSAGQRSPGAPPLLRRSAELPASSGPPRAQLGLLRQPTVDHTWPSPELESVPLTGDEPVILVTEEGGGSGGEEPTTTESSDAEVGRLGISRRLLSKLVWADGSGESCVDSLEEESGTSPGEIAEPAFVQRPPEEDLVLEFKEAYRIVEKSLESPDVCSDYDNLTPPILRTLASTSFEDDVTEGDRSGPQRTPTSSSARSPAPPASPAPPPLGIPVATPVIPTHRVPPPPPPMDMSLSEERPEDEEGEEVPPPVPPLPAGVAMAAMAGPSGAGPARPPPPAERARSEEEGSSSASARPCPLESSGSSSLDDACFPPDDAAHLADEEETSSASGNCPDEGSADFPTTFGYPPLELGYGPPSGAPPPLPLPLPHVFALSRTLSRISERSTTSEQERSDEDDAAARDGDDDDDDSTKASTRSPSADDESLLSSDRRPSLSSDPPSGTELAPAPAPPAPPPPLLPSDDEWPSPPSSSSPFETPVVSHVETFYLEIRPEEAHKVTVVCGGDEDDEDDDIVEEEEEGEEAEGGAAFATLVAPPGGGTCSVFYGGDPAGSSTDDSETLHDEEDSIEGGEDGAVRLAVRPQHYSSLSEDTASLGTLSLSEWSSAGSGQLTVRPRRPSHSASLSASAFYSSFPDDTSASSLSERQLSAGTLTGVGMPGGENASDGDSSSGASAPGSSATTSAPPRRRRAAPRRRHRVAVELEVRDGQIVAPPADKHATM